MLIRSSMGGQPVDWFPGLAACLSSKRAEQAPVFALQIGAMDGVQFDPLHRLIRLHSWHALLVEPQPDSFAALKGHYADETGIVFANCAICDVAGTMPLSYVPCDVVEAEGLPAWVLGISSLSREHVEALEIFLKGSAFPGLMKYVQAVDVEVLTLPMLLEAYGSPSVDVLQIDAEGFDYKILRQWDFSASAPSIINFEHARLDAGEKARSVELLLSQGYVLYRRGLDVTAFRSEMLDI